MTASGEPTVSHRLFTVPNGLTLLRLLLVPLLLILMLGDGDDPSQLRRIAALVVFLVAAATDRLDGMLARRHGDVTRFGVVADPIADKALVIGAFAALAHVGDLSWWVVALVVARELTITGVRLVLVRRGRLIPAAISGKAKTVLQIVTAAVLLLPSTLGVPDVVTAVLVLVMVVVTLVSGLEILMRALLFDPRPA